MGGKVFDDEKNKLFRRKKAGYNGKNLLERTQCKLYRIRR